MGHFHNLLREDGHVTAPSCRVSEMASFVLFFVLFCMDTIAELNKIRILRVWEEGGVDIE